MSQVTLSKETLLKEKALEILIEKQQQLEDENTRLKNQIVELKSVAGSKNPQETDSIYRNTFFNGVLSPIARQESHPKEAPAPCKPEESGSLLKLVEQWEASKASMFSSLEQLLDMDQDDQVKLGTIKRYIQEKKRSMADDKSFDRVQGVLGALSTESALGVDVPFLKAILCSLVSNLDTDGKEGKEGREAAQPGYLTLKHATRIDFCLENEQRLEQERLPKGLRLSINSLRSLQQYLKVSTGDPLLVRKVGNFWHSTDEYSYVMITKMMKKTLTSDEIMQFLRTQLQGRYNLIKTSFGNKLRLYADYTASGQELCIFNSVFEGIVENYANTHTEASYDGKFMNKLFHEAEAKILTACNADPKTHSVLPLGTGATGAIEFVQKILGTYIPPRTRKSIEKVLNYEDLKTQMRKQGDLPLVIITAYEHHSNEVTWRNQLCDIEVIPLGEDGYLDFAALRSILEARHKAYKRVICSFSAGSNVTGIKTDIDLSVRIAKEFGALIFFDYAGTGPYVQIDMSKAIDGVYLSPHKFIGGPGTCGLAIIKNKVYDAELAPTHGGGGTVDFVNSTTAIFSNNIMAREKSGTPGILQIIKAGLVFDLKSHIFEYLQKREKELMRRFFRRFVEDPRIYIFGPLNPDNRVPIVSFNIRHNGPQGQRILHPVFVVRLLSDLFGIQGRGGCSCAGPYGHRLLHINKHMSERFMKWVMPLAEDATIFNGIKLGWARINLHYSFSDEELDYIMSAIDFIAEYGHMFLPYYVFNPISGNWQHLCDEDIEADILNLKLLQTPKLYAKDEASRSQLLVKQLEEAKNLIQHLTDDFEVDPLQQWEELAFFYVAKGNLQYGDYINQRRCCLGKADFQD